MHRAGAACVLHAGELVCRVTRTDIRIETRGGRPIVVIFMADGSHFARERLMAFALWHLDAVSGSHPPHLL